MDSVTQITLGAAVGEAVLGRQLGNKAIYWGGVFGTLPDLDAIFTPLYDSIQFIVHHRGLSHSLLSVVVLSPILALGFERWYQHSIAYGRWFVFFFLVLLTHILLDCCTSYGTQLLVPFSDVRIAWNTVFIIDPLYTVPFLTCVLVCLFLRQESRWRRRLNLLGLVLSTGYLALAFLIQHHVKQVFEREFHRQDIAARRLMVCPTPFNTVLWYGLAEENSGYRLGFYSLLDRDQEIQFQSVPRHAELLGDLAATYEVNRLIWFADGYFAVRRHENGVILHVLKFGKLNLLSEEELFPFSYRVFRANPRVHVERFEGESTRDIPDLAGKLWRRICGEE